MDCELEGKWQSGTVAFHPHTNIHLNQSQLPSRHIIDHFDNKEYQKP